MCWSRKELNASSFLAVVGVPVQVSRTITALAIAYFIVRTLAVFEIERSRRLEVATQQRFQAQQEALEAQCQVRQEIEQWSKRSEDVVNTISMAIGHPVALEEMLNVAIRKTLELTELEMGGVLIQEALANVRKHSQASNAWVRFEADGEQAVITVEDDGRGFDPSRIWQDRHEHFGLQTMRERAESVGGVLQITTQHGRGTRLTVQLPLSRQGGK